jgi:hypothetical protein
MKVLLIYLIFLGTFPFNINIRAQKDINPDDDIGIKISEKEFNALLDKYSKLLKLGDTMNVQDYIIMVRLSNTIGLQYFKNKNKKYEEFDKLFRNQKYIGLAIKKLEARQVSMCYYSEKYDLFIGSDGVPHENSVYKIIKQKVP